MHEEAMNQGERKGWSSWRATIFAAISMLPILAIASQVATYSREGLYHTSVSRDGAIIWRAHLYGQADLYQPFRFNQTRVLDRTRNIWRSLDEGFELVSPIGDLDALVEISLTEFRRFDRESMSGDSHPWITGVPLAWSKGTVLLSSYWPERGLQIRDESNPTTKLFEMPVPNEFIVGNYLLSTLSHSKSASNPKAITTHIEYYDIRSPEIVTSIGDFDDYQYLRFTPSHALIFIGANRLQDWKLERVEFRDLKTGALDRVVQSSPDVDQRFITFDEPTNQVVVVEQDKVLKRMRLRDLLTDRVLLDTDIGQCYETGSDFVAIRREQTLQFFHVPTGQLSCVWQTSEGQPIPIHSEELLVTRSNGELEVRDFQSGKLKKVYWDHTYEFPWRCLLIAAIVVWEAAWLTYCRRSPHVSFRVACSLALALIALPVWMRVKWGGIEEEFGWLSHGMVAGILTGTLSLAWCSLWLNRSQLMTRIGFVGLGALACTGVVHHQALHDSIRFAFYCTIMLVWLTIPLAILRWKGKNLFHVSSSGSSFQISLIHILILMALIAGCIASFRGAPHWTVLFPSQGKLAITALEPFQNSILLSLSLAALSCAWIWTFLTRRFWAIAWLVAILATLLTAIANPLLIPRNLFLYASPTEVPMSYCVAWVGFHALIYLVFRLHCSRRNTDQNSLENPMPKNLGAET